MVRVHTGEELGLCSQSKLASFSFSGQSIVINNFRGSSSESRPRAELPAPQANWPTIETPAALVARRPAKIGEMAKQKQLKEPMPPLRVWAGPVALGWLVPGGGHFLLKRNGRAALLLVSITLMYLCGLMMRGAMFQPQNGDLLTILINTGGFIGDCVDASAGLGEGILKPGPAEARPRRS